MQRDPVEVADGVLRQRAAPPLHVRVDGPHRQPDRVGEVLERELDELVVGPLEGLLLAVPAQRAAHHQQPVVLAPRLATQSHFAKEYVEALTDLRVDRRHQEARSLGRREVAGRGTPA